MSFDLRDRRDEEIAEDERRTTQSAPPPREIFAEELSEGYARALQKSPDDPIIHLKFGVAALEQGRGLESLAVEALGRYTDLEPEDPAGHYRLGLARAAVGDYEGATVSYMKALALDKDDPDVLFALHFAHLARLRFKEARYCVARARKLKVVAEQKELDPRLLSCWEGIDLLLDGDDDEAEPFLRDAESAEGATGEAAHYALALLAVRRGDRVEADIHRRALESRKSLLTPALAAAIKRGSVEPVEAVRALTANPGRP
jgi:Flp pilus assembly protein TadD